jgi:hypothetical protein
LEIELAWIKLATEPIEHLPVFFVLGIFNSLQEFVVAPDSAAVFRRTGVLPLRNDGLKVVDGGQTRNRHGKKQ